MWVLLPVKGFALSKSRLGCLLSVAERAGLSAAMFRDVLAVLRAAGDRLTVVVVTDDADVAACAIAGGCRVEPERGAGINLALDRCAGYLGSRGVGSLLVLPADVPMVACEDIEFFLGQPGDSVIVVPAAADGGTNALYVAPPGIIGFQFGTGSAARHHHAALAAGVDAQAIARPNLARDIDRPEDLLWLLGNVRGGSTAHYLERSGLAERLALYHWEGAAR